MVNYNVVVNARAGRNGAEVHIPTVPSGLTTCTGLGGGPGSR